MKVRKEKFNSTLGKEVNEVLIPALNSVETAMQSKSKLQLKCLLSIRDMLKIA